MYNVLHVVHCIYMYMCQSNCLCSMCFSLLDFATYYMHVQKMYMYKCTNTMYMCTLSNNYYLFFFPLVLPDNCEFVVNFSPELAHEVIAEAKYLEKLGYSVPDMARSVALQEDKFVSFQDSLNRCLQRYHFALAQLNEAEVRGERG